MKLKTLIIAAISVVLTAAAVLLSIGYYAFSQQKLDKGLAHACGSGNGYAAAYWLAKGANVNTTAGGGIRGETPLLRCVHIADRRFVEMLLTLGADPNAMDEYGMGTALHRAESADVADLLVVWGADLNKKNKEGLTPLQYRMKPNIYKDDELIAALEGNGPSTKLQREIRKKLEEANKAREAKEASGEGK